MKIYNILMKPGVEQHDVEKVIVVEESFSIKAFVFQIFWLIYNRLWFYVFIISVTHLLSMILLKNGLINFNIFQGIQLVISIIVAVFANTWYIDSLRKQNYSLKIIAANNREEAKFKYYQLNYGEVHHAI